jgi:hypothetical protein
MDNIFNEHQYGETVSATKQDLIHLPDSVLLLLEKLEKGELELRSEEENKKEIELWFSRKNELCERESTTIDNSSGLEVCGDHKRQRSNSDVSNT